MPDVPAVGPLPSHGCLERQGYFNSADFDLVARSIEELARIADVIIPGHDNYFLNRG